MIDTEMMIETGLEETGPKQMRTGEVGANQGTTDKDIMTGTPETDQERTTDQHTTERVVEIGEILDQEKEK